MDKKYKLRKSVSIATIHTQDKKPTSAHHKDDHLLFHPSKHRQSCTYDFRAIQSLRDSKKELEQLRNLNQLLLQQNMELKGQIEYYKRCEATRNPHLDSKAYQNSVRDILLTKLTSRTKCSERLTTESGDTHIQSKDQSVYDSLQAQINVVYQKLIKNNTHLKLPVFEEILLKYMSDSQHTYTKLQFIFDSVESCNYTERYAKVKALLELLKVPIVHKRNPERAINSLSKIKTKSRVGSKDKESREKAGQQHQSLGPEDMVGKLEEILLKISKSHKLLSILRGNKIVRKFVKNITDGGC